MGQADLSATEGGGMDGTHDETTLFWTEVEAGLEKQTKTAEIISRT